VLESEIGEPRPGLTTLTVEVEGCGYFILNYLKKAVPPKKGSCEGQSNLGREQEVMPLPEDITSEAVMAVSVARAPRHD
jgi:hypothetical protein